MKVKCPQCGFKGEIVNGKCLICELPLESRTSIFSKIPKKINTIAIVILFVIIASIAFVFIKNHVLSGDLNGEVFIVTRGGENIRLGLVEVILIPEDRISEFILAKEQEYNLEKTKINKKFDEYERKDPIDNPKSFFRRDELRHKIIKDIIDFNSGKYLFNGLPEPTIKTKTDADGKFTVQIKRGARMALAAHGRRSAPQENYYWLIWVSLDGCSRS